MREEYDHGDRARTPSLRGWSRVEATNIWSYGVEVYWYTLASSDTTVKMSRSTLSHLERLREELHARSLDETVRELIKSHRQRILGGAFGVDKGRLKPFRDE